VKFIIFAGSGIVPLDVKTPQQLRPDTGFRPKQGTYDLEIDPAQHHQLSRNTRPLGSLQLTVVMKSVNQSTKSPAHDLSPMSNDSHKNRQRVPVSVHTTGQQSGETHRPGLNAFARFRVDLRKSSADWRLQTSYERRPT